jgi:RNA polymerase sigma-70 factor, ECF subfamily
MAAPDPDAEAVRRVLAGDINAFEDIVRRWQGRLLNLAWRFSRDRGAAEAMAQDAFVAAYRALATFRGESAFSTWLTAVALNTYRARLRRDGRPSVPLDATRLLSAGPDAERQMLAERRTEAIRLAVTRLPPKYRDALVLFYFEEMDLAETARTLRLREGTLKARLHRGRALLKKRCAALHISLDDEVEPA